MRMLLSILTCAISFPTAVYKVLTGENRWPVMSYEEATLPGNWVHRSNSYWVTTVRKPENANFLAKLFAFQSVLMVIGGLACLFS